jgi:hypothetical protein
MHASGRCLRDPAGKSIYFCTGFWFIYVWLSLQKCPNHHAERFLRDATRDALTWLFVTFLAEREVIFKILIRVMCQPEKTETCTNNKVPQ